MEPSHPGTSEVAQYSGPQHVSHAPEGSPNPMAPQYVHAMPAVTTNDNYNKVINDSAGSHPQVVKLHPEFFIIPTIAWCDKCEMNVDTITKYYMGCTFWIVFILYLLLMPYCICCPFINKRYWNVRHRCSKCHHKLGIYKAGRC